MLTLDTSTPQAVLQQALNPLMLCCAYVLYIGMYIGMYIGIYSLMLCYAYVLYI